MLILSRKKNESIFLRMPDGTEVDVMVTDIRRADSGTAYVKLGISAPQSVTVVRAELDELRVYTGPREEDKR